MRFLTRMFCILLLIGLTGPLAGCEEKMRRQEQQAAQEFHYVKDHRTGLCFAYGYRRLAHVPCTAEVEALLFEQ
ncbi:hypothetical protein AMJ57_01800 [Parcubacteria bacterium SG8_24]|nr:MAG: hypothetical protein AMJ57_01800 [Parcubacteria bacterium SG8_24]